MGPQCHLKSSDLKEHCLINNHIKLHIQWRHAGIFVFNHSWTYFFFGNFLFRSDISFLEGGNAQRLEKIYQPRAIFNIPGSPCSHLIMMSLLLGPFNAVCTALGRGYGLFTPCRYILLSMSPDPTSLPYPYITPLSFSLHAVLHRLLRCSNR
jgi:hypothetical protein